jgi:urea transport system substrate-binding protein
VVSFYVMTHYDALMALKAGLEKSGEISREAAVDGMAGLTYEVPTGASTITTRRSTCTSRRRPAAGSS